MDPCINYWPFTSCQLCDELVVTCVAYNDVVLVTAVSARDALTHIFKSLGLHSISAWSRGSLSWLGLISRAGCLGSVSTPSLHSLTRVANKRCQLCSLLLHAYCKPWLSAHWPCSCASHVGLGIERLVMVHCPCVSSDTICPCVSSGTIEYWGSICCRAIDDLKINKGSWLSRCIHQEGMADYVNSLFFKIQSKSIWSHWIPSPTSWLVCPHIKMHIADITSVIHIVMAQFCIFLCHCSWWRS